MTLHDGFDEGALSQAAEDADAEIRADIEGQGDALTVKQLVEAGASIDEITAHPDVAAALTAAQSRPRTADDPTFGTETWDEARVYTVDGQAVTGTSDALNAWEQQAERLAWVEAKATPEPVARERVVTIILGPPAAGKSTIANELAISGRAAILDSDEIKKSLPEYDEGLGAQAVHEESSRLAKIVQAQMIGRGTNIILPKVGDQVASIETLAALYQGNGYRVRIVNMRVTPEEAKRRMFGRFADTGRIIDPRYLDEVGDAPSETFRKLQAEGAADGYAEIDNNGPAGSARSVGASAGDDPLRGSRFDVSSGRSDEPRTDPARNADGSGQSGQADQGLNGASQDADLQALITETIVPIRTAGTADDVRGLLRDYQAARNGRNKLSASSATSRLRQASKDQERIYGGLERFRTRAPAAIDSLDRALIEAWAAEQKSLDPLGRWANEIDGGTRTADQIIASPEFKSWETAIWSDAAGASGAMRATDGPRGGTPVAPAPAQASVPEGAVRVAGIVDRGDEVSTGLDGMTAAEKRWLSSEYEANRLQRRVDPMMRNRVYYRRPVDDGDYRYFTIDGNQQFSTAQASSDLSAAPAPDRAAIDAARAELGTDFADMEIDLPDGTTARVSDVMDDLDADEGLDAVIQACAITPKGAAQ